MLPHWKEGFLWWVHASPRTVTWLNINFRAGIPLCRRALRRDAWSCLLAGVKIEPRKRPQGSRNPLPIGQSGFVTNSLERLGVSLQRCKMKSCPRFPRRRAALKSGLKGGQYGRRNYCQFAWRRFQLSRHRPIGEQPRRSASCAGSPGCGKRAAPDRGTACGRNPSGASASGLAQFQRRSYRHYRQHDCLIVFSCSKEPAAAGFCR